MRKSLLLSALCGLIVSTNAYSATQWKQAIASTPPGPITQPGLITQELYPVPNGRVDPITGQKEYRLIACEPFYNFQGDGSTLVAYQHIGDNGMCGYTPMTFHAETQDNNPPATCPSKPKLGNPVVVGTGVKIQSEEDIPSLGRGTVGFTRYYNNGSQDVTRTWFNVYEQRILVDDESITPLKDQPKKYRGNEYESQEDACLKGWNEIKPQVTASWAQNATAVFSGSCQIVKNGEVARVIPLLPNTLSQGKFTQKLKATLVREDGSTFTFVNTTNLWRSTSGEKGKLETVGPETGVKGWRFTTEDGTVEEYSLYGFLASITSTNGIKQTLTYDATDEFGVRGNLTQVMDSTGRKISFVYSDEKLRSVTTDDNKKTSYFYEEYGLLSRVTRPNGTTRLYHFEDIRFPWSITGITDERGVRYVTWTYDATGRAISSEHAGGADKVTFTYNADGSTTVTNPLGKKTIYRFKDIAEARLVTSVEGQPSDSCAAANKAYTYTKEGWLQSQTDWKGIKTVYSYNTKGQEISRTEGYGTPEQRIITTEWHPTLNRKTRIVEPDHETVYRYDTSGQLIDKQTRVISIN